MWTSVSGLLAHGEKMNVIGNNISNVNTVGFKGQRMDFMDFVYQYTGTAAGVGQVGRGTSVGIVMNDFLQGSLETTTSSTDIAISGNGFFKVKPKYNNESYYTRAGNFTFDREGYLVDPNGYVLQGWAIDRNAASQITDSRSTSGIIGTGSPVDVRLDTFTCPPRHTTNLTLPVNLKKTTQASESDKSTDGDDPFFALLKTWDATQEPPLGTDKYAYQSTIEVYDEAGKMHKLTVYYDRVADGHGGQTITDYSSNESYWEYIVTMDPSEDVRDFDSVYSSTGTNPTSPNVPDSLKGLLGAGTITFDSSGQMKDMSFFVPSSEPGTLGDQWWTGAPGSETVDLTHWIPAPISSNGYPMITPNFSGAAGLQTPYTFDSAGTTMDDTKPNVHATGRMISIDIGLKNLSSEWHFPTTMTPPITADKVGSDKRNTNGVDGFGEKQNNATTNYGDNSFEHSGRTQDGYTYGDLRYVNVDTNGVLSATYSNGVTLQLFQITLHDFPSTQNLRREGGNLFSETRESGIPSSGAAGTGTFGTTRSYSLEQSNVDLSREFVNMITTQRGFQANSKTITTVDTMLETVIGMKR